MNVKTLLNENTLKQSLIDERIDDNEALELKKDFESLSR